MTTGIPLFELAGEIARVHERSVAGTISVVPVIVDDLQVARPVLRAICDVLNGRLLDIADPAETEFRAPVVGTLDPVRRAAVAAALVAPSGRRVVLQDLPDGRIDATLEDPPLGADPSPAEETLIAFARSVVHRDLDAQEFATIAFAAGPIDLPFRRAVWHLVTRHLAGMPSATLRTLLVVAETAIDVSLHCETDHGFRFALEGDRLLRRQSRDNLMAAVGRIAGHPRASVLCLGAGFAASSRLPLGDAVRDGAIRRLLKVPAAESPTSIELAMRFHRWLAEVPGRLSEREERKPEDVFARELTLERVIRVEKQIRPDLPTLQEFREHHDSVLATPGSAVRDLAALLQAARGRVILAEVNFDLLVEAHAGTPLSVFASESDFEDAEEYLVRYLAGDDLPIPLLKFHGTITDFDTCVVTDEQTERGVGAGKLRALRSLLGDERSPRLWTYVGMSMRDRDLLRVLTGEDFARGLEELWVSPYLVDTVAAYGADRAPFWEFTAFPRIEDRLITETADAFFAALRETWTRTGSGSA